jgi:hypothetical protein
MIMAAYRSESKHASPWCKTGTHIRSAGKRTKSLTGDCLIVHMRSTTFDKDLGHNSSSFALKNERDMVENR